MTTPLVNNSTPVSGASAKYTLIAGASGGLGAALAAHYAGLGHPLSLWGRDVARLEAVARTCRAAGAIVRTRSLDLTDTAGMLAALAEEGDIALAVLAAGTGETQEPGDLVEDAMQVAHTLTINFTATAALAAAVAQAMGRRWVAGHGGGTIVVVGSAASFHALPFAPAYAGSKAGLAHFADALRIGVRKYGVRVTLVSPGFIGTMAGRRASGARPFEISPQQAAVRIARAADGRRGHAIFPWPFAILRWVDRLLPGPLRARLLLNLAPKE